ncbi:MAG: LysM peptidoglycan-binding domain-containing protein [Polyangiaceae bacterium]|nr:LysM peptidoglycan-binding domain-containing protein [Polyangiaceae bacterium]
MTRRPGSRGRWLRPSCLALLAGALLLGIGSAAGPIAHAAPKKEHRVESGQSLWGIARRYGVTVDALCAKNGISEDAPIKPGQVLLVPAPGEKPSHPPAAEGDRGESPPSADGSAERPRNWVLAKPGPSTQTQKTSAERGGINPCLSPDPGWGVYDHWSRAPTMGQMITPHRGGVSNGRFDVMFHFHGHEPVRKEWVRIQRGAVLVGIDLGIGSGPYEASFRSAAAFGELLASVERAVAEKNGLKAARARKIGLSAWSAGYGAVGEILRHPKWAARVDTVVLLDGLHAGYDRDSLRAIQLAPFVDFARRARGGETFMFVSHSSIIPPGYASTTETANYLIQRLGGRPSAARPRAGDPWGLELISRFDRGDFHVRGFRGNDQMDHCAHIGLYKDVLKVYVAPRWSSPRGYAK